MGEQQHTRSLESYPDDQVIVGFWELFYEIELKIESNNNRFSASKIWFPIISYVTSK